MNTLTHKGYGRIYVEKNEDIQKVKDIIKKMSEFEFDYLPKELITTFDQYPSVTYTYKFSDLDTDHLTVRCWKEGVKIFVFDARHDEFPPSGLD